MKNKKLTIALFSILAVLGLILFLATPAGLVFVAVGIIGIIYCVRSGKQPADLEPVHTQPQKSAPVNVTPSRKAVMTRTTNVAGVTFNCQLDREYSRQEVFNRMWEGEQLSVERYTYKGTPALLLVDQLQGLDIGNVPANLAEEIEEKYPQNEIEAYLVEIDSFWPDDKDEEIITAKVKLFVLASD